MASSATAASSRFVVPALAREGRLLGGVAGGIAAALGVDPIVVRACFVVLTVAGGLGVLVYLVAWVVMGGAGQPVEVEVLEGVGPAERVVGLALVTVGLALGVSALDLGFAESVARPIGLVGLGLLVAWHRGRLGALVEGDRSRLIRVAIGLVLTGAGIAGLVSLNLNLAQARDTLLLSAAVVGGLVLVAAPTVTALVRDLGEERRQRIRSEERARMAAHLHDSVLQTLSLIQRHADDPGRMRALARSQERELRSWLYGAADDGGEGTVGAELERVCADVEQLHGVPVELVVVGGEKQADARAREAIAAVREAIVNAAKHAGADRVDVFAEMSGASLDLFVRDTGAGFEPGAIPDDRRGLRDSVRARMERVGGRATITSRPGEGTEIELNLPLESA